MPGSSDLRPLLAERVVATCDGALARLRRGPAAEAIEAVRRRLDEPLRLAVAGRVKAGKSTLVNALLGRVVAPTAVGECTRVVTCFRYGFPERADVLLRDGGSVPLRLTADGALPADLGVDPAGVRAVDVQLSIARLRQATIVDTPGLASAADDVSARTRELLALDSASASAEADALLYVFSRVPRADEAAALATFGGRAGGRSGAAGAIGVLTKADLIGDEPRAADRVAEQARAALRAELADVIPVTGLLAETATARLRSEDLTALRALARLDPSARALALRSPDQLREADVELAAPARERLLELLDVFGLRRSLEWIDAGCRDAAELERRLRLESGIGALEARLDQLLWGRADVLKAGRALQRLERIAYMRADAGNREGLAWLRDALDALALDPVMHAIDEAWALEQVSSGSAALPAPLEEELRRVVLNAGLRERLGAGGDADAAELQRLAVAGATRWRAFLNGGATSPAQAAIGQVVCRTYEALWRRTTTTEETP